MPNKGKGRSTIVDVAQRAGVSPTTVSLVLSGKADKLRIVDETVQKVRQSAEELNYTPNTLAQSIRAGRTQIISFYSAFRNRESNDLYIDRLSSAVEYAGGTFGYDILVHCNFRRSAKETYGFLNGGWADGLILFAPNADDPLLPLLRSSRLPTVLMNARDQEGCLHSIKDDVASGIAQAVDELVRLGHRRIAMFLLEDAFHRDAVERRRLFEANLARHGLSIPPEFIVGDESAMVDRLRQLMSRPDHPTAIFAWHDRMAYRILEVAEELGIRVPEQLSVVGYDGMRWPSATSHVAASVKVDIYEAALGAMRLLDDAINGRLNAVTEEILTVSFDKGTTLGPAPDPQ